MGLTELTITKLAVLSETMTDRPYHSLYLSKRWKVMRFKKRQANPLCERHLSRGEVVRMTQVHHKIPHKGNRELFYDESNLESLCNSCHDAEAQQQEKIGYSSSIGPDGWPYDPAHPANRRGKFE